MKKNSLIPLLMIMAIPFHSGFMMPVGQLDDLTHLMILIAIAVALFIVIVILLIKIRKKQGY